MLLHPVALWPGRSVCCRPAIITCAVEEFKSHINSAGSVKDPCSTEFDRILPDAITTSDIENRTGGFENLKRFKEITVMVPAMFSRFVVSQFVVSQFVVTQFHHSPHSPMPFFFTLTVKKYLTLR